MSEVLRRSSVAGKIQEHIEKHPMDIPAYNDMLSLISSELGADVPGVGGELLPSNPPAESRRLWHEFNAGFRNQIVALTNNLILARRYMQVDLANKAYKHSLFLDALVDFDAYMLYIESDRDPEKRFYLPRRNVLHPIANDMSALQNGDLDLLAISLPPGVGKTSLAIFFLTWIGGKNPDRPILSASHDAGIVRGMYDEIYRIIKGGEYLWGDIFPLTDVISTNAKDLRIDLGKPKRFETYQFTSVGAGNAGKLRASQLLYCDDLVESIEQAMSRDRMDKLWMQYTADLIQRKSGKCPELHIATRWSVWDVIGRLERRELDDPTGRAKFVTIPALNADGESNFDYPGIKDKFTTEDYRHIQESTDDVTWRALYMNQPIEREGQLYSDDELRRFYEIPGTKPDAIVAICDTKTQGSDYAFMPVAYVYGDDLYIVDCVCDNGDPGVVEERLAQCLVRNNVQVAQFESNAAGGHIAEKVQGRAKELGGVVSISTKYTTANKETKIIVNAPWVKQHCLFLDGSKYRPNSDYGRAMAMLTGYTMYAKNKHDDVPDGMAMLALYMQRLGGGKVEVFSRPW